MATHVIRSPVSSSSRPKSNSNCSRSRIEGGGGEVYQSTNPCLDINPDLVLGIARLERYVLLSRPPSSFHRRSFI
jgi:hypothetical protein